MSAPLRAAKPRAARVRPALPQSWRQEAKALSLLSGPIILTNLGQMALHTTDVIFIGRLGADALAAAALGASLNMLFFVFGMGLIMAISPLMAQAKGAKSYGIREVRRVLRQGFWTALILAVPMMAILSQAPAIFRLLGQEPDLGAAAGDYVIAALPFVLPGLLFVCLRNFIAALERPMPGVAVVLAGIAFNAFGNYALIFGHFGLPALGLEGAGYATALTNLFLFLALAAVVTLRRPFRRYYVFARFWKLETDRLRTIFTIGLPIAVTLLMEVGLFAGAAFLMGLIGRAELAAHQIAIQVASVTFMIPMGLAQAATVRVGLAVGRRDESGRARAGFTALALGVGFMAVMAVLMVVYARPLTGIFLNLNDPANAATISFTAHYLLLAALFQVFDAGQAIGAGALRGLNDTRIPMIFAAVSYWVIGLTAAVVLAFPLSLDGTGIWIGFILGLAAASVLMLTRFALLTGVWRRF